MGYKNAAAASKVSWEVKYHSEKLICLKVTKMFLRLQKVTKKVTSMNVEISTFIA